MVGHRARGLSLWLVPEGAAAERLTVWIERLAARYGSARFTPHLTLASALELPETQACQVAARLPVAIPPLTLALHGVDGHDEHFRCLFVRVAAEPELRAAHAHAERAFGREADPAFFPHLSLVYGTLAAAEKRAIAGDIGGALDRPVEVRRLQLWRTEGPVTDWRELAAFELGRRAPD